MKPTFFVGRPDGWIERRPDRMLDVVPLYDHIIDILEEHEYEYEIGRIKTAPPEFDICLAHHTNESRPNVWNIKKGYFPKYLNWDRDGYSGWSEMANSEELFQKSQQEDLEEATEFFNEFTSNYIGNNESKFPQANDKFNIEGPYVFVACQRPRDTVSALARIDTISLAYAVVEAFRDTVYKVVVKRHPRENMFRMDDLKNEPHVVFAEQSIHKIIPGSSAVFTVNSGVGLESMLHLKPVYTAGKSDYEWITRKLNAIEDIPLDIEPLSNAEKEAAIKFVYYLLTKHFVYSDSRESVEKKITMCVDEWRKTQ